MNNRTSMTFNRFKSLILEQIQQELTEASTKWSTMFEQIICESWNIWRKTDENDPPKVTQLAGYGDKDVQQNSDCNTAFELSKNIYESIKRTNLLSKNDELIKLANESNSVTNIWKAIGLYGNHSPNNTPKTDICVKGSNKTFSVKADTGNQLMSGTVNELLATIVVGIAKAYPNESNNSKIYTDCNDLIAKYIGIKFNFEYISSLIEKPNSNVDMNQILQSEEDKNKLNKFLDNRIKIAGEIGDYLDPADKYIGMDKKPSQETTMKYAIRKRELLKHINRGDRRSRMRAFSLNKKNVKRIQDTQQDINKLLEAMLSNDNIKREIYFEAASGAVKFGTSASKANYVLVWDRNGICTISSISDYLKNHSDTYKTSAHFKSSSDSASNKEMRNAWTVMSISGGKAKKK